MMPAFRSPEQNRNSSVMKTNTLPKTWFITGTSSGFGRTLTEKLLARGDRVAATLRKVNVLDDLKAQYGDDRWVASLDVTDAEAVRRVVDRAFATMGRIDVVVNNAAYGLFGAAEEVTDDQIRHQIDTNLIGSIQVTRAALPHMRAQGRRSSPAGVIRRRPDRLSQFQ